MVIDFGTATTYDMVCLLYTSIEWNHKEFTDDEMKKICDEMSM